MIARRYTTRRRRRAGQADVITLTATTATDAATVTLRRVTPVGESLAVDWGDGGTPTTVAIGATGSQAHEYATAGTYTITITPPRALQQLELDDAQLGGLDTSQLQGCPITHFYVHDLAAPCVVDSAHMVDWDPVEWRIHDLPEAGTYSINTAHMAAWNPTTTWRLALMPAGSYVVNTAHMVDWRSATWHLHTMPAGTYTVDSAHMVDWDPVYWLMYGMPTGAYTIDSADLTTWSAIVRFQLNQMPAGTYSIDTAHLTGWNPTIFWRLYLMPAGTYSIDSADLAGWTPATFWLFGNTGGGAGWTLAAADFAGWITATNVQLKDNSLSQAQVNAILYGMYQASIAPRTATGGTIDVGGTNAAPSGTHQAAAACPVDAATPGKEVAHELLNDGCGAGFNVWATVNFTA